MVELVSGTDGAVSASYEHGPFAEAVRVSGVLGSENVIRWSTKFTDPVNNRKNYGCHSGHRALGCQPTGLAKLHLS